MYIRIPIPIEKMTASSEKTSRIYYRCPECGRENIEEYKLTESNSSSACFSLKDELKNTVSQKLHEKLNKRDDDLFRSINLEHDYSKIGKKVFCSNCGLKQPWSGIPQLPSKKVWLLLIPFYILLPSLRFLISESTTASYDGFLIYLIPISLILLYIGFKFISKRIALKKAEAADFEHPIYYNSHNMDELLERMREFGIL